MVRQVGTVLWLSHTRVYTAGDGSSVLESTDLSSSLTVSDHFGTETRVRRAPRSGHSTSAVRSVRLLEHDWTRRLTFPMTPGQ
jgi:hypothetical protein